MTHEAMPPNAIQTHTGGYFDLFESGPDAIQIEDIAQSLSMQCRYNGHIRMFYSVAEHSVLIARYIYNLTDCRRHALEGLLHDASEAYLCDIPRPFKKLMPQYKELEQRCEKLVAERFGLQHPWSPEIMDADLRILADEKKVLMLHNRPWPGMDGVKPLGVRITGLTPAAAKILFLEAFKELTSA